MKELQELRNYILELRNMDVIKKTTEITLLHKLNALEKQFAISGVSQQRELLLAFLEFYHNPKYNTVNTTFAEDVDVFLANNCA